MPGPLCDVGVALLPTCDENQIASVYSNQQTEPDTWSVTLTIPHLRTSAGIVHMRRTDTCSLVARRRRHAASEHAPHAGRSDPRRARFSPSGAHLDARRRRHAASS